MRNTEHDWEIPIDDVAIYVYSSPDFYTELAVDKRNGLIFAVRNHSLHDGEHGLNWFIGKRPQDVGAVRSKKSGGVAWGMRIKGWSCLGFAPGGEKFIEVDDGTPIGRRVFPNRMVHC